MMRVLNLFALSVTLRSVVDVVRYGDHSLDFEHEEEAQTVKAIVMCKKCLSEISQIEQKSALLSAPSDDIFFVGMAHTVLSAFQVLVPSSCQEASDLNICREVLEE